MASLSKEDWAELIQLLEELEKSIISWNPKESSVKEAEVFRNLLQTFHTSAAMLNLDELARAGKVMEHYLVSQEDLFSSPETITILGFALDALLELMRNTDEKGASSIKVDRVVEILEDDSEMDIEEEGLVEGASYEMEDLDDYESEHEKIEAILGSPPVQETPEVTQLRQMLEELGGELSVSPEEDKPGTFQMRFRSVKLEQVKRFLLSFNPDEMLAPLLSTTDNYLQEVLNIIKEFMAALARGDMDRSQEILLLLAEQRHQAGIYDEIGVIARELHNSLKSFMSTIDTAFRELVEDRIPDSGNRLEHILQLTEKAATTTLNYVEVMQVRNKEELVQLSQLRDILHKLNAIGEKARERLTESHHILEHLNHSVKQNHGDLITVLTAQDYQDLTGQVILKIIKILKDLEFKLVNIIRTFGVKVERRKEVTKDKPDELYGPAYEGKEGALQSQDDVDNLLAEFGF